MAGETDEGVEIAGTRMLDCRGMRCPLPVIYTRRALTTMTSGEVLVVTTTDPGSVIDFADFSRLGGMEQVAHREEGGDHIFLVRKP